MQPGEEISHPRRASSISLRGPVCRRRRANCGLVEDVTARRLCVARHLRELVSVCLGGFAKAHQTLPRIIKRRQVCACADVDLDVSHASLWLLVLGI